jgi:hypothetical protein
MIKVGDYDREEYTKKEQEILEMVSPAAFYRSYPVNNQDIAFVGLNPYVDESPKNVPSSVLEILSPAVADLETFTEACVRDWTEHYLTDGRYSQGYHRLFEYLNYAGFLKRYEKGYDSSYVSGDRIPPCYQEVYFTNWIKLGTPSKSYKKIRELQPDLFDEALVSELNYINPSIIFVTAQDTLRGMLNDINGFAIDTDVYDDLPSGFENESTPRTLTEWFPYVGYAYDVSTMPCPVITAFHPNHWNTHSNSSETSKKAIPRLKKSINTIAEEI